MASNFIGEILSRNHLGCVRVEVRHRFWDGGTSIAAGLTRVDQFNDGAVVVQWGTTAEFGDRAKNIFHRPSGRGQFQTGILEEISIAVLGLGNLVGH